MPWHVNPCRIFVIEHADRQVPFQYWRTIRIEAAILVAKLDHERGVSGQLIWNKPRCIITIDTMIAELKAWTCARTTPMIDKEVPHYRGTVFVLRNVSSCEEAWRQLSGRE